MTTALSSSLLNSATSTTGNHNSQNYNSEMMAGKTESSTSERVRDLSNFHMRITMMRLRLFYDIGWFLSSTWLLWMLFWFLVVAHTHYPLEVKKWDFMTDKHKHNNQIK